MSENLSIKENDLNHFFIQKLIDLKAEINLHKFAINAVLSKINPEDSYIQFFEKIPKEAFDALQFQAAKSITDELKTISNDFDDLIQSFLNPS